MGKTKRTYQPSKVRRSRKFGFRARLQTVGGKRTLKARRRKGRSQLAPATMGNNKVEKNKRISRRR